MSICYLDVETISLERDYRHVWEIGLILPGELKDGRDLEVTYFVKDVPLEEADFFALSIGRFHERHPYQGLKTSAEYRKNNSWAVYSRHEIAEKIAERTWGRHIVGAVPSFDDVRLWDLLKAHGQTPGWHYHLIDIEAIVVGYLAAQARIDGRRELLELATPPYDSEELSRAIGVDPDKFDRHTGIGDCRWTKAMHQMVLGWSSWT